MENKKNSGKTGSKKRAYETYFQDYEDTMLPDGKHKRVYVGKYYVTGIPLSRQIMIRILYGAAWLIAVILFLTGASAQTGGNFVWYVTLPQAVTVPFLFLTGWSFFSYFPAVPRIKEWDYLHSVRYLKKIVQVGAIAMGCSTITQFIYLILHWNKEAGSSAKSGVFFLIATLLLSLIYYCEKKIEYRLEE